MSDTSNESNTVTSTVSGSASTPRYRVSAGNNTDALPIAANGPNAALISLLTQAQAMAATISDPIISRNVMGALRPLLLMLAAPPRAKRSNVTISSTVVGKQIQPNGGVGTQVKLLLKSLGISAKADCGCNAIAAEWDKAGIEWCEKNQQQLIDYLIAQGKKLGWIYGVAANLTAAGIVRTAIERASGL